MWNRLFGGAGWKDEAVSAGILWNAAAVDDCYEIGSLCLDWVTVFHYFATFLIRQIRGRTVLAARGKTVMICPGRRVRAARGAAAGGPVTRTHSRPLMLHSLRCLSWLFKVSRVVLLSCVMALSLNLNTAHTTIKQTSKCLTELIIWELRYNITLICFFCLGFNMRRRVLGWRDSWLTWWSRRWRAWAWRGGWCSSGPACCLSPRWSCAAAPSSPSAAGPLSSPPHSEMQIWNQFLCGILS